MAATAIQIDLTACDPVPPAVLAPQKRPALPSKQVPLSMFFTKKPVPTQSTNSSAASATTTAAKRMGRPSSKAFVPALLVGLPVPSPVRLVSVVVCVQESQEVTLRLVVERYVARIDLPCLRYCTRFKELLLRYAGLSTLDGPRN